MYQRIHRGRVIDYKLWKNAIISQFLYGKLRDSRTRVNNADNFQFDAWYGKQITITGDAKYSSRGAITNEVKIVNEIRAPEWRAFDARWDY